MLFNKILGLALGLAAFNFSVGAQEPPRPLVVSTNAPRWPVMDYTNFLAGHPDEAKRQELWNYFLVVEPEAERFAGSENHWKPIQWVVLGKGIPLYISSGKIRLNQKSDWAMFHEIFHDTFSHSAFHGGGDKAWAEAFCDAFRYMMEKKYLPDPRTKWFLKVDRFADETYEEVMSKSGDKRFDQRYVYPASLVVHKANKDLERFRALWFELQALHREKEDDVLDAYFGYDMEAGRPL